MVMPVGDYYKGAVHAYLAQGFTMNLTKRNKEGDKRPDGWRVGYRCWLKLRFRILSARRVLRIQCVLLPFVAVPLWAVGPSPPAPQAPMRFLTQVIGLWGLPCRRHVAREGDDC